MKQNVNKSELITKTKGPVWKIKIGVHALISERETESKPWEVKVILN